MSQKKLLCLAALSLVACGSSIEPADMQLAQQQCERHGGVKSVARHEHGMHLTIFCASGLLIEIKRHNEKAQP